MVKTRGLKEAKEKLGDIEKIISDMIKAKKGKKLKIFESGCGYGKVMVELKKIFGNKIEIVGMNLIPLHGTKRDMINYAKQEGIITRKDMKDINSIKIIYGDAGQKLPFKTGSINFIYSQTSTYLYKDKLHFFEEVARVLKKEGIARITIPESRAVPKEFQPLLRIYKDGKLVLLERILKKHKLIRLVKTPLGKAIEIKSGKLNFGLKLEAAINIRHLRKDLTGMQSIYSLEKWWE